jgi:hypothetical protein
MKKIIYFGLLVSILAACQNRTDENTETAKSDSIKKADAAKTLVLPYSADYNEQTQKLELKQSSEGDPSKLSVADMIDAINIKYPEIKLQMVRTGHDTIYVKINDAAYLSENLGSAGSQAYLAEATYALTEIAGIKVVNFAFTEGDHASPGSYTRKSF